MMIRAARPADRDELVRMRQTLWPDSTAEEVDRLLTRPPWEWLVLVADGPDGALVGFAELGIRPFADGCVTSPVAYLEGLWTDAGVRRAGVASALVEGGVAWARSLGLSELASDCEIDNATSHAFHLASGFAEVGRSVNFKRDLSAEGS